MEKNHSCTDETSRTKSFSKKKEFAWEIENFEDWWSCRDVAKSEREQRGFTTMKEEYATEIPKDWSQSSHSPTMTFVVEGIEHEFEIAVLKYDSYDRYDNEHCLMMGISAYYKGPLEHVIIKPTIYIVGCETRDDKLSTTRKVNKNTYSECRIFGSYNVIANKRMVMTEGRLTFKCTIQMRTFQNFSSISSLESNLRSKEHWTKYLKQHFDFSCGSSPLDPFSDFEITCIEKNENGETNEKKFQCHKLVLFLASNYYKKMFSGTFSESNGTTVVTDVNCETMSKLLQYIYSGEVKKNDIDIDLLLAADKYEVEHLSSICELELGKNIATEIAPNLAMVASMCGSDMFKSHVYAFVRKHWKQISTNAGGQFMRKDPKVVCEIWDKL